MIFLRIILLNYNQSRYTINLVENLRAQSFRNFEVVVVDNASNQKEIEVLKTSLPRDVYLIYSPKNLGYARGNNLGMKLTTDREPDFYLVMNNDITIENDFLLEKLLDSFNYVCEKPIVAVSPLIDTVGSILPIDKQIQVRRILPTVKLYFVCCSMFKPLIKKIFWKYIYRDKMPFLNKHLVCDSINGAAFMVKADFMRENNYFDEGTFLFFEEIIFGRQIKDAGGTCLLNGYVSVKHLQGLSTKSSSKTLNIKMERYKYKSELYYFRKYCDLNMVYYILYIFLKETEILLKIFFK